MLSLSEHRTGITAVRGYEASVDNNLTGIGFGGSAIINTVSEAEPVYIVSTSANDTYGGTGATEVAVVIEQSWGEDTDIEMYEFRIKMDGTSQVALDAFATGVVSLTVDATGSGNTNAGVISVKTADTDTVLYTIPVGVGTSQSSLHTSSFREKIKQLNVYTDATTTSNVPELYEVVVRKTSETNSGDFSATASGNILATFFATPGKNEFEMYDNLEVGDKVWVTAKNVTNSNSNAVSTEMIIYRP